jgi:hypothetical protein
LNNLVIGLIRQSPFSYVPEARRFSLSTTLRLFTCSFSDFAIALHPALPLLTLHLHSLYTDVHEHLHLFRYAYALNAKPTSGQMWETAARALDTGVKISQLNRLSPGQAVFYL